MTTPKKNKSSKGKPGKDDSADASLSGIHRSLTLVAQVEQILRKAIEDSRFPGGRLPTLVELADQLRVSRETVRLALDSLQREGLITKRRRRGTFVNSDSVPAVLKAPRLKVLGYLLEEYDYDGVDAEIVARPVTSAMLEGAIIEAGKHDYQLITRSAKPLHLREAFDQLQTMGPMSGVIFACVAEEKFLKGFSGLGIPAILLDHEMHLPKIGTIRGDSTQNAILAVKHLAEIGHERIACAQWHQNDLNPWFLRGYRKGMREVGLKRSSSWELLVELNQKGASDTVDQLMALKPRPTAVVCFHNTFASQLIAAASNKGLKVPEDLSVIGGGGEEVVNLTCTKIDWHHLGSSAVRMVLKAIENDENHEPEHVLVDYTLKIGGTTSPLKALANETADS